MTIITERIQKFKHLVKQVLPRDRHGRMRDSRRTPKDLRLDLEIEPMGVPSSGSACRLGKDSAGDLARYRQPRRPERVDAALDVGDGQGVDRADGGPAVQIVEH